MLDGIRILTRPISAIGPPSTAFRELARVMSRVQLQGGDRRPHARRTLCTVSARLREPTKQMGPAHRSSLASAAADGDLHLALGLEQGAVAHFDDRTHVRALSETQ